MKREKRKHTHSLFLSQNFIQMFCKLIAWQYIGNVRWVEIVMHKDGALLITTNVACETLIPFLEQRLASLVSVSTAATEKKVEPRTEEENCSVVNLK